MSGDAGGNSDGGELGRGILMRLEQLALCTDAADAPATGAITRLYLSRAHREAVDLVSGWMREAGMNVRLDAAGSVVGRYEGASPDAPTLLLGSHIDSVPNAGKFDGNLGVVTAIAVVARLHARGQRMPFAIETVAFGDEEGTRFSSTLGGSRALAGVFDPAILQEKDTGGVSRRDALVQFGCDPERIGAEARSRANHIGYVELHIEQGPVLEAEGLPVGVVTAINGASRGTIEVRGSGGHAGTVPMAMRRDAFTAAAEMALAIEQRARSNSDLVATIGRVAIDDAAVNSVPGTVRFSLDIRSPSDERRLRAIDDIRIDLAAIAKRRGVELDVSLGYSAPAAPCDEQLSELLAEAVVSQGIRAMRLASGAGHDAMSFRGRLPIAMLFVRCRGGVSHSPLEFSSIDDIDAGARTLVAFLDAMARQSLST